MTARNQQLEILVGVTEIRDLAEVKSSAVVTNWRARFPTFPEPRISGTQPRFELEEVLDWLRHDGPRGRSVPEPEPMWRWQRLVEAFAAAHPPAEARAQVAALVAVRDRLGPDDAWREVTVAAEPGTALRRAARAAERRVGSQFAIVREQLVERLKVDPESAAHLGQLAGALDAVLAEPGRTTAESLTVVLDIEPNERRRSPQRTRPALARLMVAMAAVDATDSVFDPAAGEGDVLEECARRTDSEARLCGQEYDAGATFVAAVRLLVRGAESRLSQPGHDSLRDDQFSDLRATVVVLDPPVGGEYPLHRWIQHAVEHLAPDGRLVMALPLADLAWVPAARRQPDDKLRAYIATLLAGRRSDALHLDGVAVLPRGTRSDVVGPVAVFALSGAARRRSAGTVPVAWLAGRSRSVLDDVVSVLDDAMVGHGARGLGEVESPDVSVAATTSERVFDTLERLMAESGDEGSTDDRRWSMRSSDNADASRRSDTARRSSRSMSDNAQRAAVLDSLTATAYLNPASRSLRADLVAFDMSEAAAVAADDDDVELVEDDPLDTFEGDAAADRITIGRSGSGRNPGVAAASARSPLQRQRITRTPDALDGRPDAAWVDLESRASGAKPRRHAPPEPPALEPVDLGDVRRATEEVAWLLDDARRGRVSLDPDVVRRLEDIVRSIDVAVRDAERRGGRR